jgi:hypothetical protein
MSTDTATSLSDFADQFPSAEVIGVDISPIQPGWVPPNLRFQIDDVQLPWTYPPSHFDFIHIRNLHGGISDWPALYAQCFQHTRPGGYIEDLEFNIRTLSDRAEPDHIYNQWNALFAEAGERMGRTFQIYGQMKQHISDVGYVDVVEQTWNVPIGGWAADSTLKSVGMYTLLYLEESLEGFALYMLKHIMGWEYEEIQVLVAKMRQGLRSWRRWHPYYEMSVSQFFPSRSNIIRSLRSTYRKLVYGRKPELPEKSTGG